MLCFWFSFFFTLSRRFIDGKLSDFLAGVICSFRASCFICYHYLLLLFLLLLLLLMFGGGLSTVLSVSHALTHLLLDEFVAGQNKIEKRGEKKPEEEIESRFLRLVYQVTWSIAKPPDPSVELIDWIRGAMWRWASFCLVTLLTTNWMFNSATFSRKGLFQQPSWRWQRNHHLEFLLFSLFFAFFFSLFWGGR